MSPEELRHIVLALAHVHNLVIYNYAMFKGGK